jgi:hypothetical protein
VGGGRGATSPGGGALRAQMGPVRACGGGAGWVGPRARPNPVGRVFFSFFRIHF